MRHRLLPRHLLWPLACPACCDCCADPPVRDVEVVVGVGEGQPQDWSLLGLRRVHHACSGRGGRGAGGRLRGLQIWREQQPRKSAQTRACSQGGQWRGAEEAGRPAWAPANVGQRSECSQSNRHAEPSTASCMPHCWRHLGSPWLRYPFSPLWKGREGWKGSAAPPDSAARGAARRRRATALQAGAGGSARPCMGSLAIGRTRVRGAPARPTQPASIFLDARARSTASDRASTFDHV